MLRTYTREWSNYSVLIQYLPNPFAFIERGVPRAQGAQIRNEGKNGDALFMVRNIMYTLWNGYVFETIQPRLLSAGMELIMKERLGESIESSLVIGVRESFVNYDHGKDEPLNMYTKHFEKQYIEYCRDFYKTRALQVNFYRFALKLRIYRSLMRMVFSTIWPTLMRS